MHFDKSFFISLATHTPERIERFYKRSKKENLSVELWPGIYGLDVNIKEYQDKGYLTDDFTLHLPGSLGCMLSHVSLWDHINQDPNCDIALIFEDDILFKKNFLKKLKEIPWSDVPEDWDIIKLSCGRPNGEKISDTILRPSLSTKKGVNSGTFCYLMKASSAPKLKSILFPYNNTVSMDVILRQNFKRLHIYIVANRLVNVERYRYSIRKALNFSAKKQTILEKLFMKFSKFFLS
tara:strand:- start:22 stop:729 length:708 start_codon:yes stop_codon:yes gene_type:complete